MDLDLLFLGTSASMPTAQRAPAAFLIRRGGEKVYVSGIAIPELQSPTLSSTTV